MILLGLTGGVGMGKSTAAEFLSKRGFKVIDSDLLAREVVEPGQPALEEVQRTFGADIIDENGRLRRERLAQLVFGDERKRRDLEAILHPRIKQRWLEQLKQWRLAGERGAVAVIPLLYETGADAELASVLCVACSQPTQRERLLGRGWNPEQVAQRKAAQWPIETKMNRARFVVWTEGELTVHEQQIDRLVELLKREATDP